MRPSSSSSPQSPQVEPRRASASIASSRLTACHRRAYDVYRSVQVEEGPRDDAQGLRCLRRRAPPRADRSLQDPPAEAPARARRVGGRLRDRAACRRRRAHLPAVAHARVRGLDDLPLPPDGRPDARRRSGTHSRGHGPRRRRRAGDAPEPVAVRALLRRPRTVDGARACLQRLRDRALHAVLRRGCARRRPCRSPTSTRRSSRSNGSPPAGSVRSSCRRSRRCRTTRAISIRCGPPRRRTACTCSSTPRPAA